MIDYVAGKWEEMGSIGRAMVLVVALVIITDQRTWKDRFISSVSCAIIVFIGGSAIELLQINSGWIYILAGAIGGYGLDPTKEFVKTMLERVLHK